MPPGAPQPPGASDGRAARNKGYRAQRSASRPSNLSPSPRRTTEATTPQASAYRPTATSPSISGVAWNDGVNDWSTESPSRFLRRAPRRSRVSIGSRSKARPAASSSPGADRVRAASRCSMIEATGPRWRAEACKSRCPRKSRIDAAGGPNAAVHSRAAAPLSTTSAWVRACGSRRRPARIAASNAARRSGGGPKALWTDAVSTTSHSVHARVAGVRRRWRLRWKLFPRTQKPQASACDSRQPQRMARQAAPGSPARSASWIRSTTCALMGRKGGGIACSA